MFLLAGVIAVKLTIPLLASWFGVTITITGSGPIAGMYLYLLSSFIVSMGIAFIVGIVGLVLALIYFVLVKR
jgi:hypothetical protein